MALRFACATCGCPSVKLPTELTAQAIVACNQCDAPLTTWAEFKRLTTTIVLSDREASAAPEGASYDPLEPGTIERGAFVPEVILLGRSTCEAVDERQQRAACIVDAGKLARDVA